MTVPNDESGPGRARWRVRGTSRHRACVSSAGHAQPLASPARQGAPENTMQAVAAQTPPSVARGVAPARAGTAAWAGCAAHGFRQATQRPRFAQTLSVRCSLSDGKDAYLRAGSTTWTFPRAAPSGVHQRWPQCGYFLPTGSRGDTLTATPTFCRKRAPQGQELHIQWMRPPLRAWSYLVELAVRAFNGQPNGERQRRHVGHGCGGSRSDSRRMPASSLPVAAMGHPLAPLHYGGAPLQVVRCDHQAALARDATGCAARQIGGAWPPPCGASV